MHITILRKHATDDCTIGELYIDGTFFCFTLEDEIREVKVKDETAIPAGLYNIKINYSPKFKEFMPLIEDVPGFDGIRIHAGNNDDETSGCILVGMSVSLKDCRLVRSRAAYDNLMVMLDGESDATIEIINNIGVALRNGVPT